MQADTLTIPGTLPLIEVLHLFVESQVGAAPVLDANGGVLGLLTSTDLLQAIDQAMDEDEDPGEPEELVERLTTITAAELATPEVVWIAPATPALEVARQMRSEGLHRVLVGEGGRLAGILTTFDLLAAVA